MKFYARIKLDGIGFVRFSHMADQEFKTRADDLLLTDPGEWQNRDSMSLCIRDLGEFKLTRIHWKKGADSKEGTGCLEYDDFVVGTTPDDRPLWFDRVKDRIVETTASNEYGHAQGLRVAESVAHGSAEARIRCEQSKYVRSGCVFKVMILAKGDGTSFGDAVRLHAMLLSGEAYSARK